MPCSSSRAGPLARHAVRTVVAVDGDDLDRRVDRVRDRLARHDPNAAGPIVPRVWSMNAVSTSARAARDPGRSQLELPERLDTAWNPSFPEFAAAANAVSLLMPHVEPYVARTRSGRCVDQLDEPLAAQADGLRRPGAPAPGPAPSGQPAAARRARRRCDGSTAGLARTYGWLVAPASTRWSLAFAAGFETSAFALARWSERHLRLLFDDADPAVRDAVHLAPRRGGRAQDGRVRRAPAPSTAHALRYLLAGLCSLAVLAWFTVLGTVMQLGHVGASGHRSPGGACCGGRISLAFEVLPDLFVSAMPGHHPSQFSDPTLLVTWLASFDPATGGTRSAPDQAR